MEQLQVAQERKREQGETEREREIRETRGSNKPLYGLDVPFSTSLDKLNINDRSLFPVTQIIFYINMRKCNHNFKIISIKKNIQISNFQKAFFFLFACFAEIDRTKYKPKLNFSNKPNKMYKETGKEI